MEPSLAHATEKVIPRNDMALSQLSLPQASSSCDTDPGMRYSSMYIDCKLNTSEIFSPEEAAFISISNCYLISTDNSLQCEMRKLELEEEMQFLAHYGVSMKDQRLDSPSAVADCIQDLLSSVPRPEVHLLLSNGGEEDKNFISETKYKCTSSTERWVRVFPSENPLVDCMGFPDKWEIDFTRPTEEDLCDTIGTQYSSDFVVTPTDSHDCCDSGELYSGDRTRAEVDDALLQWLLQE